MKYNNMRRFVVYRQVRWRCEVCDPLEAHKTHNNIKYTSQICRHTHTHTLTIVYRSGKSRKAYVSCGIECPDIKVKMKMHTQGAR